MKQTIKNSINATWVSFFFHTAVLISNGLASQEMANLDGNTTYQKAVGVLSYEGRKFCMGVVTSRGEVTSAYHCLNGILESDRTKIEFQTWDGQIGKFQGIVDVFANSDLVVMRFSDLENVQPVLVGDFRPGDPAVIFQWNEVENQFESNAIPMVNHSDRPGILRYALELPNESSGAALFQDGKWIGVHLGFKGAGGYSEITNLGIAVGEQKTADLSFLFQDASLNKSVDSSCVTKTLGLVAVTTLCIESIPAVTLGCATIPVLCPAAIATAVFCGVTITALSKAVIECGN